MARKVKALGLALVAAFAIGAVTTSAAQAEQSYRLQSGPSSELAGAQAAKNKFHIPGAGSVECSIANFTDTVSGTAVSSIDLHPTYVGCVAFGFASTHFSTSGCDYRLGTPVNNKASMEIICFNNNKLKITPTFFGTSVCTVEIGPQSSIGIADLANNAGETDVLITWTTTKISHTAGCGASAAADGEYTGSVTEEGVGKNFWVK